MSAPQTDLDKQKKRHRGAMTGIFTVVGFALLLLVLLLVFISANGNDPEGAETQIDARTGEEIEGATD